MSTHANHPSFRSTHTAPPIDELRTLAADYDIEVVIEGGLHGPWTLDFGHGYIVEDCGFEAACEEIREYAN